MITSEHSHVRWVPSVHKLGKFILHVVGGQSQGLAHEQVFIVIHSVDRPEKVLRKLSVKKEHFSFATIVPSIGDQNEVD